MTMHPAATVGLFVVTALAEITGCYLPYLWLRQAAPRWVLVPAAVSLAVFAWLLTLHPTAAGRVYAAYGGIYVATAVVWLWLIDGVRPDRWDLLGATVTVLGMAIIFFGPRG
jgi:small multidrug resistance family-3 protein